MEYLRFVLFLLAISIEILFVIRFFHFEKNIAPLAVILFNTLVLYLFAIMGILTIGAVICAVLSVICLVIIFISKKSSLQIKFEKFNEFLPIIVFWSICIIAFLYTRGTLFHEWDEFSHWGVIYKYLMVVQQLPNNSETVSITYPYPPFSALWQYLTSMAISFKEENAYFAHTILQFSSIIACFPPPNKRRVGQYIFFLIASILAVFYFSYTLRFHLLYVDLLMGLLFAAGLAQLPLGGKQSLSQYVLLTMVASSLLLIKPTGIIFAGILIFIEIIYWIKIKDVRFGGFKKFLTNWRLLLLVIFPLALYLSWGIFVRDLGSSQIKLTIKGTPIVSTAIYPWSETDYMISFVDNERDLRKASLLGTNTVKPISIQDILRAFTVNTPYQIKVTARNFIQNFSDGYSVSHSHNSKYFLSGIFLLNFAAFLLYRKYKDEFRDLHGIYFLLLLAGIILYSISLYLAYAFLFDQSGTTVPSLERYLATYLIAWWIFTLSGIYSLSNEVDTESLNIISKSIGVLLVLGFFIYLPTSSYIHLPPSPYPFRFEVNKLIKTQFQTSLSSKDKIYEVYYGIEGDNGFRHFILRYLLTPIPSNFLDWNIRTEVDESDHSTMVLSPEEWLYVLNSQHYTYVLVSHSDALFWQQYGELFNTYQDDFSAPQVFKVTDEGLLFVPLE